MMWNKNFFRIMSSAPIFFAMSTVGSAEIPHTVTEQVSKAVVLVQARKCRGDTPERDGTGFAYGRSEDIVTAYHVVAGCSEITLWYEHASGQPFRKADISRVLKRNDLALLHTNQAPSSSFLTANLAYDKDEDFQALGYGDGSPSMGDLDLRISFGSDQLKTLLPTPNLQQISTALIDPSQQVVRFKSPLQPGMSGGPIFDKTGKVIAIVAGGLKSGAVPSSWGWPAGLLASLQTSQDLPDGQMRVSGTLFAFSHGDSKKDKKEMRTCGSLEFRKGASVAFMDAANSSDDIARLMTTIVASGVPKSEIDQFRFDTWVHDLSGATVVVPSGVNLEEIDGNCVAESDDGTFQEIVRAKLASTPLEVQMASVDFEKQVILSAAMPNLGWYPDNVLTQGIALTRPDGLVVNRKAIFVAKKMLAPGRVKAIHQFETIMARGGSFVGIGMINNDVEQCFNSMNQPVLCTIDPDYLREWAKFVFATQMSTYPVY